MHKTDYEMWKKHLHPIEVNHVIRQYYEPKTFQSELVEVIKTLPGISSSIEVGCETGVSSMLLDSSIEKTFLDYNEKAILLCKSACDQLNINGEFIHDDMFTFEPKKKYDLVFNAGVIEHYSKQQRTLLLKRYKKMLTDDGVIVIAFPNHYSFPYMSAYLTRKYLLLGYKWRYPKEYKIYDMKEEIEDNNLQLIERLVVSKKSLFRWWDFCKPMKKLLKLFDKYFKEYQGYLTVLVIKK
jgi:2-polyprenyl-3-methyl-5-hydroxy-6-metoxy-1,4-benzoquinol methylase